MTIAILCPTRGRPQFFQRMESSIKNTANSDIHMFAASNGGDDYAGMQFPVNSPTCFMWNKLAELALKHTDAKLFMLGTDDVIFTTPCWDEALLEHYNGLEQKVHVYSFRDSRDPDGTPHPIVTREYIEAMGYFLPPIFLHWFVDTWTVAIAKANNAFTHLKDYLLVHDKPSDKGKPDETHSRIRDMGWLDRDRYVNDHCQHFLEMEKKRLALHVPGGGNVICSAKRTQGIMIDIKRNKS